MEGQFKSGSLPPPHMKLSHPSLKLSETPNPIKHDYKVLQQLRKVGDSWRLQSNFRSLLQPAASDALEQVTPQNKQHHLPEASEGSCRTMPLCPSWQVRPRPHFDQKRMWQQGGRSQGPHMLLCLTASAELIYMVSFLGTNFSRKRNSQRLLIPLSQLVPKSTVPCLSHPTVPHPLTHTWPLLHLLSSC